MKRSKLPTIARVQHREGRPARLGDEVPPIRAGVFESTWMVPSCQGRPSASSSVYSIFGP